jgi:hypothetical protein
MTALFVRPQREQLLYGALLTTVVGTLETAIAQVVKQHYLLHPGALPDAEKEFSLAELADFEDLDDAKELAISRRVEGLVRGGLESWNKTFKQLLKIDAGDLADDLRLLTEVIQRRHLVVHNAGRVSRQYMVHVSDCDQKVGETLKISREYLEEAIDAVAIFGIRLIFVAWGRWVPTDAKEVGSSALDIVFEQLLEGRDRPARCIAETAEGIATSQNHKLALRVNAWQATKRIDGVEAIQEEVEDWDTSALAPQFSAAQAALVDDFERLFAELPEIVSQGHLDVAAVRNWPLFKEAREQEGWSAVDEKLPMSEHDEQSPPDRVQEPPGDIPPALPSGKTDP